MRVGIVGAGPMGLLHAKTVRRIAARGGHCKLARILDRHQGRAVDLADEVGAEASDEIASFAAQIDAAIVAVPTAAHFEVARALLMHGLDLLVEKPFTAEVDEGIDLVNLARAEGCILQVGHVEWYNPAWREAAEVVGDLRRIEVDRLQPRSERGRDIDVIQDLMLHDLDWTTRLVGEPILDIEAINRGRESDPLDAVDARVRFAGGCVVDLRSSRVHFERQRRARFEGTNGQASVDFDAIPRSGHASECKGDVSIACRDPLEAQWADFMAAVHDRVEPVNNGSVGVDALRLVDRVRSALSSAVGGANLEDDSPLRR